jgi:hypothetical protein
MDAKLDGEVGLAFLLVEIRTGLTLVDMAKVEDPHDPVKIAHSIGNARKAYETVQRLRQRVDLNEAENAKIDEGLQKLESALEEFQQSRSK